MSGSSRDGAVSPDTERHSPEVIERVCRNSLRLDQKDDCRVSYYDEGGFNTIYLVELTTSKLIMRISSFPIAPRNKTLGEVTTLRFVGSQTGIPVPRVVAFDASTDNDLGAEWILMDMMSGVQAWKRWRTMSMSQKVAFVKTIVGYQMELRQSKCTFRGIGTLGTSDPGFDNTEQGPTPVPGPIVSRLPPWLASLTGDIPQGPFRSVHDWLMSDLQIAITYHSKSLEEAEVGSDKEHKETLLRVLQKLVDLLPKIFPTIQEPEELSCLWHGDLSFSNILVDEEGKITALIDWECVSALPVWVSLQWPAFLTDNMREEKPKRDDYADASDNEDSDDDGLDNEGKTRLFWEHMLEYELTGLRGVYRTHMQRLCPSLDLEYEETGLKMEFLRAVKECSSSFGGDISAIEEWVDAINAGEFPMLY